jgi:hypothetical protein
MRKRLTLAGLIIMAIGIGGWIFFTMIPQMGTMPPEAALGWLVLFPIVTFGALLLGVIGLIITILGLVLKGK